MKIKNFLLLNIIHNTYCHTNDENTSSFFKKRNELLIKLLKKTLKKLEVLIPENSNIKEEKEEQNLNKNTYYISDKYKDNYSS